MPTLNVTVLNKIATGDRQIIVCDNTDYVVHFELDAEWNDYDAKTMRVLYTNGNYDDIVFTGTDCDLPRIYNAQSIRIGIYAGDLHATAAAVYECKKSVLSDEGQHVDPPEDVYNQIMDAINSGVMDGVGIDNILKTSTVGLVDTYTITYTDGTTTTYDITNGAQGTSITNIAKTGTSGNVDTYTITMSNGDTYTFTVTNGSVTSVDGLTGAVELDYKANIDGYYDGLTSGTADQLLSNKTITDNTPYVNRQTGGGNHVGDRKEIKEVVGSSVVWNQLAREMVTGNYTTVYSGDSVTIADGVISVTASRQYGGFLNSAGKRFAIIQGHRYLIMFEGKATTADTPYRTNYALTDAALELNFTLTTSWTQIAYLKIAGTTGEGTFCFQDRRETGWDECRFRNLVVVDLTTFNSTIADRAYTLEQSTAGSGVAWLKSYGFFTKPSYAYTASPSLQSVKTSAHETIAYNQFDADTIMAARGFVQQSDGSWYSSNGKNNTGTVWTNDVGYKGQINLVMTVKSSSTSQRGATFQYNYTDGTNNKAYYTMSTSYANNSLLSTSGKVVKSISLTYGTQNIETWFKDICISLCWDGERAGEYEAYVKHSYPLDSTKTLNGILKLDANNEIYYDGDTYASDGTVTRNYGTRAYQSGDESLTDAITDGTNTVYKLSTPTTETADAYQQVMTEDPDGTERWIDAEYVAGNRDFEMPVGHSTEYHADLKAKLEDLPDSPNSDGDYLLRRRNGVNSYVRFVSELPAEPTEDGVYTLTATVSGGVATYSWEA